MQNGALTRYLGQYFTHRSPNSYLGLSHSTVALFICWCVCLRSSLMSWRTFTPKDTRAHTHVEPSSRGAAAAAAAAARTPTHCFYVCAGTVQTEVVNMAADGMVLTNHDHQTRVGILTGKEDCLVKCEKCSPLVHLCGVSPSVARGRRCHNTSRLARLAVVSMCAKLTGPVDCHCFSVSLV